MPPEKVQVVSEFPDLFGLDLRRHGAGHLSRSTPLKRCQLSRLWSDSSRHAFIARSHTSGSGRHMAPDAAPGAGVPWTDEAWATSRNDMISH